MGQTEFQLNKLDNCLGPAGLQAICFLLPFETSDASGGDAKGNNYHISKRSSDEHLPFAAA